jgi:predicted dehydrogenase
MIKTILIVGFGSIGKRHSNNILRTTNYKLIIFSKRIDIKNQDFINFSKNKNRIKIISNFNQCLKEKPSIAFITNETNLHITFALKLAQNRIDLFIEKPLSNNIKNIETLNKIAKKKKITIMVGCNFRFYPPIKKIKEMINKKIIGKIISAQIENNSFLPDWHPDENYTQSYASRKSMGGGVTLTQIHELDYLTWIFGNIKKSVSMGGKFSNLNIDTDDLCSAILKLENNIVIELHLDYFSRPFFKRIKIRGVKGTIYWNSEENQIKIFYQNTQKWNFVKLENNYKLTSKNVNQMYIDEIKYFFDCVYLKKEPMNNLNESLKILKTALKLKKFTNS